MVGSIARSPRARGVSLKKLSIFIGGGLLVLLIAAYFLVPVIASSIAPGIIESRAAAAITGKVKVGSVSIGWGGPIKVDNVQLLDEAGGTIGTFSAESSLGIMSALGGLKDLGTFDLSGRLDLVAKPDTAAGASGRVETNLQRAIKPKNPSPPSTEPSKLPQGLAANITIKQLDVTYKELDAAGATSNEAAIQNAKGTMKISTMGAATASADLSASFAEGPGASSGKAAAGSSNGSMAIKANLDNLTSADGTLTPDKAKIDATINAKQVPMRLVDALAQQSGVLLEAVGDHADVDITAKGDSTASDIALKVQAPNLQASGHVAVSGGKLISKSPVIITLLNTNFVRKIPAVAKGLADGGMRLDEAPRIDANIHNLNIPIGNAADLRGAALSASITTGQTRGTLMGKDTSSPTRAFAWSPATFQVQSDNFAQGLQLSGSTKATIDNASAGDLSLNVALRELLDDQGAMKPFTSANISGTIQAQGVSTQLLQPVLSALGQPIDLQSDIGPTADAIVMVQTRTRAAGDPVPAAGALPPTDIDLQINSTNINAKGKIALDPGAITTEDFKVDIAASTPLAQRIVSKAATDSGKPASLAVGGRGQLAFHVQKLRLPMKGGQVDKANFSALVNVELRDAEVTLLGANGASSPQRTVRINALAIDADLRPGGAPSASLNGAGPGPTITIRGDLSQMNQPFKIDGQITPIGLGDTTGGGRTKLPALDTMRLSGQIAATSVPGSLVQALGGTSDNVNMLMAEVLGPQMNVTASFGAEDPKAQRFALTAKGTSLDASASGDLHESDLALAAASLKSTIQPRAAQALQSLFAEPGSPAGAASLAGPASLEASIDPVTIPLKAGTFEPDFARGGSASLNARCAIIDPLVVQGLQVGTNTITAGVKDFKGSAQIPLAMLGGGAGGGSLSANLSGQIIRTAQQPPVALMSATVSGNGESGALNADIALDQVNSALADEMLGKPGYVSGAIGPSAKVTFKAARSGKTLPMDILGNLDAQKLKATGLRFSQDDTAIRLTGPLTVAWTIDPQWASQHLLASAPGESAGGGLSLSEPAQVNLSISELAIAKGQSDAQGNPTRGPLAPGIFTLKARAEVPRIALARAGVDANGRPQSLTSVIEGFSGNLQSSGSTISFEGRTTRVTEGADVMSEPIAISGAIRTIADDRGIVNANGAAVDLQVREGRVPTALVDRLAGSGKQLQDLLGAQMVLNLSVVNLSKTSTGGSVDASMTSPKALVQVGGPVNNGVLDTGAPGTGKPLKAELSEFKFAADTNVLAIFPLFASAERKASDTKTTATSRGLRIPLGGDIGQLNGALDVNVGRIDYTFAKGLGEFLDQTVFTGGGDQQTEIKPFTVVFVNGKATYEKIDIPVRNIVMKTRGSVDFVKKTMDVIIYIPTVGASQGLLGKANAGLGKGFGMVLPKTLNEGTMIPIRARGPIGKATFEPDIGLMAKEFGDGLVKAPQDVIGNVLDGVLGGGKKAPNPAPATPIQPNPGTQPKPKPSQPAQPTGPTPPSKPKKKP